MPLGAFKATLLGAAGSGGESGWVVQPYSDTTGSSPSYWMYDMAIASDDSIWATTLTNFSNNGAIWHINADGTLAADNDQKVIDPTQSGSTDTRGIAVAANGDVITVGGGPINDGTARTGILTTGNTPGTLVQDWDNSLFNPVGATCIKHLLGLKEPVDTDVGISMMVRQNTFQKCGEFRLVMAQNKL